MKRISIIMGVGMFLFSASGCISIYEKLEAFSVFKLNATTFRIASYYSYSTEEEAFDMALLKASQITLRQKKQFFIIKSESVNPNIVRPIGTTNWYYGRNFFWGAPIWNHSHVIEKDVSLTIELLDNEADAESYKENKEKTVVDARLVAKELKAKYQL